MIWTNINHHQLAGSDAGGLAWLSRALSSGDDRLTKYQIPELHDDYPVIYSVERIVYSLTAQGYEIALKQQEHNDQRQRFEQQRELNEEAIRISKSSSCTAKIALFVGIAIATSSAFNVYFSHSDKFL